VVVLAWLARPDPISAVLLGLAMLLLQFCIGIVNDVVDAPVDASTKPWKAIPSGLVAQRTAMLLAAACGSLSIVIAAAFGPAVGLMAALMLGCGLVYDVWLKPTYWAWACFSLAFALLPIYAWFGASGQLPPYFELLVPLAALSGPALQLSNGLVDLERDRAAGLHTLATGLGRRRSLLVIVVLLLTVHGLAWLTLLAAAGPAAPLLPAASLLAAVGVVLSARRSETAREIGWMLQAGSIALLGAAWLAAVS
jgi:4-hydroxybenzoate polyprenyltransferase